MENQLHSIGVTEESRHLLEKVDPRFVREGMLKARDKTWAVMREIVPELKPGMTELEARKKAVEIFAAHGVKKHWHMPSIRFGEGTSLIFTKPLRTDYRLKDGDAMFVDLGPVWKDEELGLEYEGDVGDSFVLGHNPEAVAAGNFVRELFQDGCQLWRAGKTGKEIYAELGERATSRGFRLDQTVVGHRVGDFPHQKYTKIEMPEIEFNPSSNLWILELQIINDEKKLGAFYEDLLI